MHAIDEIEELVSEMNSRGEEIGPFVLLGLDVYNAVHKEVIQKSGNPYAAIPPAQGFQVITIQTSIANFGVKCDTGKPADHISINGRTLLDIIVEQELLGL